MNWINGFELMCYAPGLAEGRFDRDAVFQALVKK